jgi:uncharacterized protein (UPF0332 family)
MKVIKMFDNAANDKQEIESSEYILQDPKNLTESELSKVLEFGKKWLADCEKFAINLAEKGYDIPKHKLVSKMGNRKWISESKVEDQLLKEFGDKIYDKVLKSPKRMESVVGNDLINSLTERNIMGNKLKKITKE